METCTSVSAEQMRWNVIRPLVVMGVTGRILGSYHLEESFQISPHLCRGVLLNQEQGRGVTAEESKEPCRDCLLTGPGCDSAGDLVKAAPRGAMAVAWRIDDNYHGGAAENHPECAARGSG